MTFLSTAGLALLIEAARELSNTAAQDPAPLTAELVLRLGGWNCRHATVRAIEVVRDVGIGLVDSNSDEREIEQEHLRWATGRWCSSSSSGPTSERVGVSCIGEHVYNWDRDLHYRYAIGRARTPGSASAHAGPAQQASRPQPPATSLVRQSVYVRLRPTVEHGEQGELVTEGVHVDYDAASSTAIGVEIVEACGVEIGGQPIWRTR